MPQYKMTIAYDSTHYAGWQFQPHDRAITNVLQDTFTKIFSQKIKLVGASRTDAGVHALGQVATFNADLLIEPDQLLNVWNNHLPSEIVIQSIEEVSGSFHPRKGAKRKTYWYHFFLERPLPFFARYGYYFPHSLDIQKLSDALQVFSGTHDFRSFCTGYEKESTVRTIETIQLIHVPEFNAYRIAIQGPGFLRYMIRRIVGASLHVASHPEFPIDLLKEALEKKNPESTLPKAPAKGLLLHSIEYGDKHEKK